MTSPLTIVTLVTAGLAGVYLYQQKHTATVLDREINRVIHATEQTRERIGMMRAEYALLSGPDRLAGLAAQHLALSPVMPQQFAPITDLAARLPPVGAATEAPAALEPPPALALTSQPEPAKPEPPRMDATKPEPIRQAAPPRPALASLPAKPALLAQATPAAAHSAPARLVQRERPAARPAEDSAAPVFAPVLPVMAAQAPLVHPPTLQRASTVQQPAYTAPFTGSALGMARTALADPVPVAMGAASGR